MAKNEIVIQVEDDGTITTSTEDFGSKEVHQQAEDFINEVFAEAGGKRRLVESKPHSHHGHVHTHHVQKSGL